MIKLKNNKNIKLTHENFQLDPLSSVLLSEEQWAELYKKREIRESISIGYLTAIKLDKNENKKNKKGE